jgi:uncharacterized protein YkwD
MRPLLALALLAVVANPALAQNRATTADPARFAAVAETLIERRIAAERTLFAPNAPPLAHEQTLAAIARGRSADMADGAPFAHEDSQGHFVAADRVRASFGPYGSIGENIMEMNSTALYSAELFAETAVNGWMKSPGHRANILDPAFDTSGIGVAVVGNHAFATQLFRGPPERIARRTPTK